MSSPFGDQLIAAIYNARIHADLWNVIPAGIEEMDVRQNAILWIMAEFEKAKEIMENHTKPIGSPAAWLAQVALWRGTYMPKGAGVISRNDHDASNYPAELPCNVDETETDTDQYLNKLVSVEFECPFEDDAQTMSEYVYEAIYSAATEYATDMTLIYWSNRWPSKNKEDKIEAKFLEKFHQGLTIAYVIADYGDTRKRGKKGEYTANEAARDRLQVSQDTWSKWRSAFLPYLTRAMKNPKFKPEMVTDAIDMLLAI